MDNLLWAIANDDLAAADALLEDESLASHINDAPCGMGPPILVTAQSSDMADLLIDHGASVEAVGTWWAPGFGLRTIVTDVADHLVEQGAPLTAHAAAGLGLTDRLAALLDADPALVNSKGGDGARPLHFARNETIARLLVERGADVHARDDDHRSNPAQWLIGECPEAVRLLLAAGAEADIFLAAGLGDLDLAQKLVATDPACTGYRIGNNGGPFPGIGHGWGGTMLQWTLGFNASPQEIARDRGYRKLCAFLMEHTAPRPKLLAACMTGDEALAKATLADHPNLLDTFDDDDRTLLARACWETNRNTEAVRIMLGLGFPVDTPEHNHGYSPLHNAAWDGNTELVKLLLDHGHPVDEPEPRYNSTPLGWCIHAATEGRRAMRDYAGTVETLLAAGAQFDMDRYPTGHEAIDAVLQRNLSR